MAEFPALPLFTDAYLGDTTHLSTTEHGAYFLLLLVSWRSPGCCLPDDDALLARYTRLTRDKWRKIRPVLAPFFHIENGQWHQARLQNELQHLRSRRQQQSEAGQASARAKFLRTNGRRPTVVEFPLPRAADGKPTPTPHPIEEEGGLTTDVDKPPAREGAVDAGYHLNLADRFCRLAGVRNVDPGQVSRHCATVAEWLKEGAPVPLIEATITEGLSSLPARGISSLAYFDAPVRRALAQMNGGIHAAGGGNDGQPRNSLVRAQLEHERTGDP